MNSGGPAAGENALTAGETTAPGFEELPLVFPNKVSTQLGTRCCIWHAKVSDFRQRYARAWITLEWKMLSW
jgi:hypothetical protein